MLGLKQPHTLSFLEELTGSLSFFCWSLCPDFIFKRARVRTLTGLFGTPRKDLRPEPSSSLLCLPPQDWAVAAGPGGGPRLWLCAPPQDGPKLVSLTPFGNLRAQREPQGL